LERWIFMASLHIDLQEGFSNDEVVVRINQLEVYHKTGVQTDLRLGIADSFDAPAPKETATIDVEIPSRQLSQTFMLQVGPDSHLGVGICDGQLEHRVSAQPFGYA
jgi:hypothetical protein